METRRPGLAALLEHLQEQTQTHNTERDYAGTIEERVPGGEKNTETPNPRTDKTDKSPGQPCRTSGDRELDLPVPPPLPGHDPLVHRGTDKVLFFMGDWRAAQPKDGGGGGAA